MKSQSLFRGLDRILVVGVIISVAISLLMILTGNDTIFGLIVGLLSLIITLILEVLAKLNKSENLLVEAVALSKALSNPSFREPIRDIVSFCESITKYEHDEFLRHASASIQQCRITLQKLASGVVCNQADFQEVGSREFERVQRDVKAIHIDPMSFWTSGWGRTYFATNQKALKRGIKVTRLFALSDADALDSIEILREHERAGVHVLILDPEKFEIKDCLIFDDRMLVYYEKFIDGSYKTENIVLDPIRVKEEVKKFETLASHPYVKSIRDITTNSKPRKSD